MINIVHNLPTNLPTDFTDGINSVGKNDTLLFFFFVLIFFLTVILSVYTEGIFPSVKSLKNIPTKIFSRYFSLY